MSIEPKVTKEKSLKDQFRDATTSAREVKVPEAIKKYTPRQTLEMPGPGGQKVRRTEFGIQLDKDRATAKAEQKNIPSDKQKSSPVVSKEKSQSKPNPTKDFNKSRGSRFGSDFSNAKGKDRGR